MASTPSDVPSPTVESYPTPDLSERPMVWFAPLPPLAQDAGRPFIGTEDYMDLFEPEAPWQNTIAGIHVFELYGEWADPAPWTEHASDEELSRVIEFAKRNGLALALETSPLDPPTDCGAGFESWTGLERGLITANRIKDLGGELHFIAMDAPYYYAGLIDDPGACQWSAEEIARQIDEYIQGMEQVFPDIVIGDTEPLQTWLDVEVYQDWMIAFRETTGYDLPFFHMDLDYGRPDWAERVKELEDFAKQEGIEFGIIYFGNWDDASDEAWLSSAGERVKRYELEVNGQPDHVLFQSWHDHPDISLPETEPYTYTGFVNLYLEDKEALGFRSEGAGANVALGKQLRASNALGDQVAANVVDGNPGTVWGAGDFPPQWIEIDLGAAHTVGEIRLLLSQSPQGLTTHLVYLKGPGTDDQFTLLTTFEGPTDDLDWLVYTLPEPQEGIQFVRVETTQSPSWVGFREIEVLLAE